MSILERDFTSDFTQVPNTILNDKTVSYKAKGLYAFMVSKPKKWEFSLNGLVKQSKETRQSIINILDELIKTKYMTKIKNRVNGRQATNKYILHLEPKTSQNRSESKILTQKNRLSNTDSVNHTTSNTKPSNTKESNTLYSQQREDFKSFRKRFISTYKDGFKLSDCPPWSSDTVFKINDRNLIVNTRTNKLLTKEDSFEVWNYLYEKFAT